MSAQTVSKPTALAGSAASGRVAVDGAAKIGVERLHRDGVTGAGVRVGILDIGFGRYADLQKRGRVPAPAAAKAFNNSGRCDDGIPHGTASAAVVNAMAPEAEPYLAAIDGRQDQFIQAARWLATQGVQIVSYSGNSRFGPSDGRGIQAKLVDEFSANGILWVNAAGNNANGDWSGMVEDRNGNGWLEMVSPGPTAPTAHGEYVIIEPRGRPVPDFDLLGRLGRGPESAGRDVGHQRVLVPL